MLKKSTYDDAAQERSLSRGIHQLIGLIFFSLMLVLCIAYYVVFDPRHYDNLNSYACCALNLHDHLVYINSIEHLERNGFSYKFNNDFGVALIYLSIQKLFPLSDPEFILIPFIFNCFMLGLSILLYFKICERLDLGLLAKLSIFTFFYFIYFAQLINKDMLTVLSFLLALYLAISHRLLMLLFFFPVFFLVRQQLALSILIYLFFIQVRRPYWRVLVVYIITSLLAAFITNTGSIIGDESLGGGFSAALAKFNKEYYIGYLIFNPIRILMYFYDAYSSFYIFNSNGTAIDVAKALRAVSLIFLSLLIGYFIKAFFCYRYWMKTDARYMILLIVSFFCGWLINPTINARYIMLIVPVILLLALYVRANRS